MTCEDYRDLAELLRDGAVAEAEAPAARSHLAGCPDCREFEEECDLLLGALAGYPDGPYLPPASRGLPPFASGSGLLGLALLAVLGGGLALGLLSSGTGSPGPGSGDGGTATAPTGPAAAPPGGGTGTGAGTPAPRPLPGGRLLGRLVGRDGRGLPGLVVRGAAAEALTDSAGLFRLSGLPTGGTGSLRVEGEGIAPFDLVHPPLAAGIETVLDPVVAGPPVGLPVRVLSLDARPVEGARVRAARVPRSPFPLHDPYLLPGPEATDLPFSAGAETGPDGTAHLAGLGPGEWLVLAEGEGYARSSPLVVRLAEGGSSPVRDLVLGPGVALEGLVLDGATGDPVPGAEVGAVATRFLGHFSDLRHTRFTRAGPDGAFRFEDLPAEPVLLAARRAGSTLFGGGTPADLGGVRRVVLRLPPGTRVPGRVVEEGSGAAVPGVAILVESARSGFLGEQRKEMVLHSGEDGSLAIPHLPSPGAGIRVRLLRGQAWAPGEGSALPRPTLPVAEGDPGHPPDSVLTVVPALPLEGTVRRRDGGPAAGVRVLACVPAEDSRGGFPGGEVAGATYTGEDGGFRFEGLPRGPILLVPGREPPSPETLRAALRGEGPAPGLLHLRPGGHPPVLLSHGGEGEEPTFTGDGPTASLSGVLLGPAGLPVPGARLWWHPGPGPGQGEGLHALRTGMAVPVAADGTFSLPLPPSGALEGGGTLELLARAPGHLPAAVPVRCTPGVPLDGVRVILAPGATLRGRVLGADGSPVGGVPLEALGDSTSGVLPRTLSGPDGSFVLTGLRPGPHRVAAGWWDSFPSLSPPLLAGGDPVEIRLPARTDLEGRVRSPSGEPAARTLVAWMAADGSRQQVWTRTDRVGAFRFQGVPAVPFRIRTGSPSPELDPGDFLPALTEVLAPPPGPLEIPVSRARSLEVLAVDGEGRLLPDASVAASFEEEGRLLHRWAEGDPGGRHLLSGLPEGPCTVRASWRGLVVERRSLPGDGSGPLDLRFPARGGSGSGPPDLGGTLLDRSGIPMAGTAVWVHAEGEPADTGRGVLTDAAGRFTVRGEAAERFTLLLRAPDGVGTYLDGLPRGSLDLRVVADAPPEGATLRGRVVAPEGVPAGGVPVYALRRAVPGADTLRFDGEEGSPGAAHGLGPAAVRWTRTGPDGTFHLGSPPGDWVLLAGHPGRRAPGPAAVREEGDRSPADLAVAGGWILRALVGVDDDAPPEEGAGSTALVRLEGFLPEGFPVPLLETPLPASRGVEVPALPAGPATVSLRDREGRTLGTWTVEGPDPGGGVHRLRRPR